jgi:hypothetical protein
MIDTALAQALQSAGLRWRPQNGDWFCVCDETDAWLIAPSGVELGMLDGRPVLMFHGASEWAFDTVWAGDVIWLPSASQLQDALLQALGADASVTLDITPTGSRCRAQCGDWRYEASASDVADAFGAVLLAVLQNVRG